MPRPKRVLLPGYPHHLIQRGNNRQTLFHDDEDRQTYLDILAAGLHKHRVHLHAYVLMDNHVHLLATPPRSQSLSKVMQFTGGTFAQYFNERYERTGSPFDGRYRSSIIDSDDYLLTCYRYIEENPVRAHLCKRPRDFSWSSHGANAYGATDPLVTQHSLYLALGPGPKERAARYQRMFRSSVSGEALEAINASVERLSPLGSPSFVKSLERKAGQPLARGRRGGDRKSEAFRKSKGLTL